MKPIDRKTLQRQRRKRRSRKRISGTPDKPRLTVFRSHKNIYAQIIDDLAGRTLVSASSREEPLRKRLGDGGGSKTAAVVVGQSVADKATQAGIKRVVFDRNGYPFHGRVKELADAARKAGLNF